MDEHRCPDHGTPQDAWPCPVATEDDPPQEQTCPHFVAELERRVTDVTRNGNFFRLLPRSDDSPQMLVQEYRNHRPYGKPQPRGGTGQ